MNEQFFIHFVLIALLVNAIHYTSNKESRMDRIVGMLFSAYFVIVLLAYINK